MLDFISFCLKRLPDFAGFGSLHLVLQTLLGRGGQVSVAIGGRGHLILFFEEFDKMRGVGEGALVTDFGD